MRKIKKISVKKFIHDNGAEIEYDIRGELGPYAKITQRDREDYIYASDLWVLRMQKENVDC